MDKGLRVVRRRGLREVFFVLFLPGHLLGRPVLGDWKLGYEYVTARQMVAMTWVSCCILAAIGPTFIRARGDTILVSFSRIDG